MTRQRKLSMILIYGLPVLLAALLKYWIYPTSVTPFNADEAIVALMARHINQGNIPTFFYGQSYMGSLDAIFVASGFRLLGEHVWVIRLIQSLLYLGTVFTTALLAKCLSGSGKAAFLAGLLTAIPPINTTLYTTVSLGGYGEMLLGGNILVLSGISMINNINNEQLVLDGKYYLGLMIWGIAAGFTFWVFGLALVYIIPVAGLIFWYLRKRAAKVFWKSGLLLFTGALIGSAPWWTSALLAGNLEIITELAGGAISGVNSGNLLMEPFYRLLSLFVFGGTALLGLRPPWNISWLMLPLLPFTLAFWMAVIIHGVKKIIKKQDSVGMGILALMGLVLIVGFIFSPYGDDPSGRYFLPLYIFLAIVGGDMIAEQFNKKRILAVCTVILVLVFNLGGIVQSVLKNPPGITTQFDSITHIDQNKMDELILFLKNENIKTGYSNYWVSYPLAFLSAEEILFVPRLPYHEDFRYTARDDRYAPYNEIIKSAEDIAYITTNHP
ncbi:MAG: hypothetical protein MUP11_04855, partial [Anaerolineales bacterium]|nr:hypothetical protein [Anaerolineales bacterium]